MDQVTVIVVKFTTPMGGYRKPLIASRAWRQPWLTFGGNLTLPQQQPRDERLRRTWQKDTRPARHIFRAEALLQRLQKTRQELEDSEQLNETLEDYIETLASRISKPEHRLREAEAGPGTTKADSKTNTRARVLGALPPHSSTVASCG